MNKSQEKEIPYTVTLDDDVIIGALIEAIVGVKTFSFSTASDLLKKKELLNPIAVFVDIHLANDECGLDIIPELCKIWPTTPVIVITSDQSDVLISRALAAGAHDFVVKPLRPLEVISRLHARRSELSNNNEMKLVRYGDVVLNLQLNTLNGHKGQIYLSSREAVLLLFLMRTPVTVVSKDSIKLKVWGGLSVSDNALDRKIYEVRKAIRTVSESVELKSVYGRGVTLKLKTYEEDLVYLIDKQVSLEHHAVRA